MTDQDPVTPSANRSRRTLGRRVPVTRTFVRSGLALLVSVVLLGLLGGAFSGALREVLTVVVVVTGTVFSFSLTRLVVRSLLWRVGSRLFVSYTLIGVVPIAAFAAMAFLLSMMVAGQLAGSRVENAYRDRVQLLAEVTEQVASNPESFADLRRANVGLLPELGYARVDTAGSVQGDGLVDAAEMVPVSWLDDATGTVLTHLGDEGWGALVSLVRQDGTLTVVYLPTAPGLCRSLGETAEIDVEIDIGRAGEHGSTPPSPSAQDPEPVPGLENSSASTNPLKARIVSWVHMVDKRPVLWQSGEPWRNEFLGFWVRTSLTTEFRQLFGVELADLFTDREEAGPEDPQAIWSGYLLYAFMVLVALTVAVYVLAALLAAILVARIARATGRLSGGFEAIEGGDFSHRIRLKGRDQLAELVVGFNSMAEHLEHSVAEVAHTKSLERELELARDLQRRLLPSPDFHFPGLEIAADFAPAAAIGGDFYHFVDEGDGRLVVVIADVSGHGLATGIVMASAKASLSALAGSAVATEKIFATLDHEIRETTSRRTFVTLGHLRFDLPRQAVEFTNAGHIYPYRRPRGGPPVEISNPSRPLGVNLPADFRTETAELAVGDFWVLLSDGIIEATNADDEIFGFDRLQEVMVEGSADESAAGFRDRVLDAWIGFTGTEEPADDRTLLVIKVLDTSAT